MNFSNKSMSVLLTIFCCFGLSAVTDQEYKYQELKNEFKRGLFERQKGLMTEDTYYNFIDPFLNRAEQELELVKYFQKNPDSKLASEYFSTLLNYNVACFYAIAKPNGTVLAYPRSMSHASNFNIRWNEKLKQLISQIKSDAKLANFDSALEYEKTSILFKRANTLYVNKLGFFKCFVICMNL